MFTIYGKNSTMQFLHQLRESKYFVKLLALALALTKLVLDLANLVTNLAKQSIGQPHHQPDQT